MPTLSKEERLYGEGPVKALFSRGRRFSVVLPALEPSLASGQVQPKRPGNGGGEEIRRTIVMAALCQARQGKRKRASPPVLACLLYKSFIY